jgi:hypothetical protein
MKLMLLKILVSLMVFSFTLSPVSADSGDLYSGAARVEDQSALEQRKAMPVALEQVMRKLTGLREFDEFPELEQVLKNARSMVVTYYYRNKKITLPDGNKQDELWLLAEFSQPAVDKVLQALELPLWKPERAPLAIWLVVDDGSSRRIMPIELQYAWEGLGELADSRGMPISWPPADAEGNYAVDSQLLWGGYTEELAESGPVDALVIAARREGPEWNIRMNLDFGGQRWSWRNQDYDIQTALEEGMHMAINEVAAANSIAASDQGQSLFLMSVIGLANADDYVRCLAYLQGLSLVDHVMVEKAGPGRVKFGLTLNALPDYLLTTLESGNVLAATESESEFLLLP